MRSILLREKTPLTDRLIVSAAVPYLILNAQEANGSKMYKMTEWHPSLEGSASSELGLEESELFVSKPTRTEERAGGSSWKKWVSHLIGGPVRAERHEGGLQRTTRPTVVNLISCEDLTALQNRLEGRADARSLCFMAPKLALCQVSLPAEAEAKLKEQSGNGPFVAIPVFEKELAAIARKNTREQSICLLANCGWAKDLLASSAGKTYEALLLGLRACCFGLTPPHECYPARPADGKCQCTAKVKDLLLSIESALSAAHRHGDARNY